MKTTLFSFGTLMMLALSMRAAEPEISNTGRQVSASIPVQIMDKLRFRIAEDPARNADPFICSVPVSQIVEFPVSAGFSQRISIDVKGKTIEEVSRELKSKLDQEYYQDAHVELVLIDRAQKGGRVMIYGAVRQNLIDLPAGEQKTILEAVLQATASEFAKLSKVKLHRMNPTTGKVESRVIDLESIKKSGDRSKDIPLMDRDMIEIPERGIVW